MHADLLEFITAANKGGLSTGDYLEQVTRQHPYFTPAQFYLLQQTAENDTSYPHQAAKTALLFNNPYWLHFQLQPQDETDVQPHTREPLTASIIETHSTDNPGDTAAEENFTKEEQALLPTTVDIEPLALTQEALMLAEKPEDTEEDIITEEEIEPVKITIPGLREVLPNEQLPAFEPMHLVDYFASQGIKLTDEIQTADKLGKQLKSFTEWLKTMKKVHVPGTEVNAGVADIAIQALAAKSNKEGEIVTEAMAEVLLQQGKAGKAIEVYKKLSLLNPSKSAFFAAKIEQLKGS